MFLAAAAILLFLFLLVRCSLTRSDKVQGERDGCRNVSLQPHCDFKQGDREKNEKRKERKTLPVCVRLPAKNSPLDWFLNVQATPVPMILMDCQFLTVRYVTAWATKKNGQEKPICHIDKGVRRLPGWLSHGDGGGDAMILFSRWACRG